MSQENIDFGNYPDDPSADAIRTAFEKVQNNFTQVFNSVGSTGVSSINQTPGAGITVNQPTGNVIISANIACLQVSTSTLSIGQGANGSNAALITSSTQVLVLDLPTTISNVTNLNLSGDANIGGNLTVTKNIQSNNLNVTGNTTSGNIYANSGTIGAQNLTGTLTTTSQPNITSVGTLTSLTVSGNLTSGNANLGNLASANYFQGDGGLLSNISASGTLANGTSSVTIPVSNGNVNTTVGGVANVLVVTAAGANLTGAFSATGNANVNNLGVSGLITATGNITGGNLTTAGIVSATGNVSGGNVTTTGVVAATSNVSGGNLTTVGVVQATGNVSGGNLTTTGALSVTGNANVGNIGAVAGVFTGNISSLNANLGNLATANYFTGTLTTNAQPNITSLGTLVSLDVTGNVSANNFIGNISGNISGNIVGTFANGNSNISIPNIDGNVNTSVNGNSNIFVVTGTGVNVAGTLNTTGNANVNNLGVSGLITATGNITGGNLTTAGIVQATGNVTGGNLTTGGAVVATGNVSGGNLTTSGALSVTGNANVGNIGATVGAFTGNISAANANLGNTATANFFTGTLTTNAQPNITSLGTLISLDVTGNVSANNFIGNVSGNISGNIVGTFENGTSNVSIPAVNGNVNTSVGGNANVLVVTSTGVNVSGTLNTTGNANVGNLGVTFVSASANVTSPRFISNVATGTSPLSVSSTTLVANLNADLLDGFNTDTSATANTIVVRDTNANINANNISGTLSTANQPNITNVGTLTSLNVSGNISSGNLSTTGVLTVTGTGVSSIAGNLDMTSNTIINLAEPTNPQDAATKQYVDSIAQGLHVHAPCLAATPDTLANITVGTVTYNNGTAGVGANLVTTGSYTLIDGVNIASVGTRILVKNESNAAHNGIYTYANSTTLVRAIDYDTPTEMAGGDFTFVQQGTLYNDTGWVMADPVTIVGTSPVNFIQFSGAGTYTAGTGLSLNGTQFSISNTSVTSGSYGNGDRVASFAVNSQGQLTSASNVVIAANAANLTGTTLASSIVNSSLTSVGTLTSLAVAGNITAGNVYANSGTIGASLLTGTLTTAAQPNITSIGTLSSLTVTGNVSANNFIGNVSGNITGNIVGTFANGNSNISIPAINGNITFATSGSERVAMDTDGAITVNAPTGSTVPLNVTAAPAGSIGVRVTGSAGRNGEIQVRGGTGVTTGLSIVSEQASSDAFIIQRDDANLTFRTNNTNRMNIANTGAVTINAPSNGVSFTTTGIAGQNIAEFKGPNGTVGIASLNSFEVLMQPGFPSTSLIAWGGNDVGNSNYVRLRADSTTSRLESGRNGNGTYRNLEVYTGGNNRMVIDTDGNVGIGTTSPVVRLQATNTSGEVFRLTNTTDNERLHFYTRNAAGTSRIESQNSDLQLFAFDAYHITFGTTNIERMRITSSGDVGIGASPTAAVNRLDVLATSSDGRIAMRTQNTSGRADIEAQVNNYWTGSTYSGSAIFVNDSAATGSTMGINNALLGGLRFQNLNNAAIYTNGLTPMIFGTNGTERMRINSSGSVTINAPSSGNTLSLAQASGGFALAITGTSPEIRMTDGGAAGAIISMKATNTVNILDFSYATGGVPASIRVGNTEAIGISTGRNVTINAPTTGTALDVSSATGSAGILARTNSGGGCIDMYGRAADNLGILAGRTSNGSAITGAIGFGGSNEITFYNPSLNPRMLITTGGNVIIGASSAPGSTTAGIQLGAVTNGTISAQGNANTAYNHWLFVNNNGTVGSIQTSGSSTTYATSSDQRLKENITDAPSAGSLIDSIQVRSFDWKTDGKHQQFGMIAQELMGVVPEAVTQAEDPDQMMGVDYSKLVPLLVKEVQELRKKLEENNEEITELRNKIDLLK